MASANSRRPAATLVAALLACVATAALAWFGNGLEGWWSGGALLPERRLLAKRP